MSFNKNHNFNQGKLLFIINIYWLVINFLLLLLANLTSYVFNLNVYWPNNSHHVVSVDERNDTVQDIIEKTVAMVPAAQKPNPQYYALRLQNMVTMECLWMNKTTKIQKLLEHIWNSACPNTECPQQRFQHTPPTVNVNDKQSVWRPELRIRYLPHSLRELYNEDIITCYFYFDQVSWYYQYTFIAYD